MPPTAPAAAPEMVARALRSPAADACPAALDVLRETISAERAVLARCVERWGRPVVHHQCGAAPEALPIDLEAVGAALDSADPVELPTDDGVPSVLALALRPRDDVPWCVAVARSRGDWTDAEKATLTALAPALTFILEHALYREQVAKPELQAGKAAAVRGRFLSVLSHELRNPLAPILMWTSTLRRLRREDAEVQRATQAIEHAVALARRLIEELSDVSRLERGLLELQRQPFDLRDAVRDALADAREPAAQKQLALVEDLPADPVPVDGDPTRLKQVVAHLLGNAIKYAEQGGRVAIRLAADNRHAELRVSDTGPGLPDALLPQLYTPFVQGPNAHGGLGVGLAITQRLLEMHGGRIEAIAHGEDGGATFVATLPRPDRPDR